MQLLVNRDGRHLGPYSFDQACQLLAEGKLHSWDLCWPDGSREWVTLDTVPGVNDKAFALREQRRSEALAAAQAASQTGPSAPNPQFVDTQPGDAQPDAAAQEQPAAAGGWGWMRMVVWSSLVVVILASVFVWIKYLNSETLIENLVRRADNLTYVREENKPFNGTAYGYFPDETTWEEINFENGQREGSRTIWHINGEVALQETYSAGVLQSATSYDFNGHQTGSFENGDGKIMLYYNTTGIRAQLLEYLNHKEVRRQIWDQDGQLLMVSPPEVGAVTLPAVQPPPPAVQPPPPAVQPTPPAVQPTPVVVVPVTPPTATNSVPTNNPVFTIPVQPVIDTTPDPEKPGRQKRWVVGNLEATTSRVAVDRRIDLIFQNTSTNKIVKVFGYPDYVDPNYWTYFNMKVINISAGGSYKTVHFQIFKGHAVRVIPAK